jgi:putative ABC transport system permease protein
MISLARASLRYESRRYMAAVFALGFSGLLIMVQVGLAFGMFRTFTLTVSQSRADLWVTSANVESYDQSTAIPSRLASRFWIDPRVADVENMPFMSGGDWRGPGGIKASVVVMPIDTRAQSLSLPRNFTEAMRRALAEPGGVIVDFADLRKLGVKVGDTAEINGRRVRVVALSTGFRAASGSYAFASLQTLRHINNQADDRDPAYLLLKLRNPKQAEAVAADLQPRDAVAPYKVWRTHDLDMNSQLFWMIEAGSGITFLFSTFIALVVGLGITSQTLRGAVLASIREYAALRALGASVAQLRLVILEQSFWIGIAGLGFTAIFTILVSWICKANAIAIHFPLWSIAAVAVFLMVVALLSGLIALRALYRSEPAELLR